MYKINAPGGIYLRAENMKLRGALPGAGPSERERIGHPPKKTLRQTRMSSDEVPWSCGGRQNVWRVMMSAKRVGEKPNGSFNENLAVYSGQSFNGPYTAKKTPDMKEQRRRPRSAWIEPKRKGTLFKYSWDPPGSSDVEPGNRIVMVSYPSIILPGKILYFTSSNHDLTPVVITT